MMHSHQLTSPLGGMFHDLDLKANLSWGRLYSKSEVWRTSSRVVSTIEDR